MSALITRLSTLCEWLTASGSEDRNRTLRHLAAVAADAATTDPGWSEFLEGTAHLIAGGGATALLQHALAEPADSPVHTAAAALVAERPTLAPPLRPVAMTKRIPGLRVLGQHTAPISSLLLHPDGQRAITASMDGEVRVWELESGALLHRLAHQISQAELEDLRGTKLRLLPDGRRLVAHARITDGDANTIWDLESGEALLATDLFVDFLLPDGQTAVYGHGLYLDAWDTRSGERRCLRLRDDQSWWVLGLLSDGRHFLCQRRHGFEVCSVHDGACVRSFGEVAEWSRETALLSDGRTVLSLTDTALTRWDCDSGLCTQRLTLADFGLCAGYHLWPSPNGRYAVLEQEEGGCAILNLDAGRACRTPREGCAIVYAVLFLPDGRLLIQGDEILWLLDADTGACLRQIELPPASECAMALHADGSRVLFAGYDGALRSVLLTGPIPPPRTTPQCRQIAPLLDDKRAVASGPVRGEYRAAELSLLDIEKGSHTPLFRTSTPLLAVDPRGGWVGCLFDDKLEVRDLGSQQLQRSLLPSAADSLPAYTASPRMRGKSRYDSASNRATIPASFADLAVDPSGEVLLTLTHRGQVQLWDAATGAAITAFAGPAQSRFGAVSAGAEHLVLFLDRQHFELWAPRRALRLHTFRAYAQLQQAVFHPDRRRLYTGHRDGTIRVWDLAARTHAQTFRAHKGPLHALALRRDGRALLTCGEEGVRLFDLLSTPPAVVATWQAREDVTQVCFCGPDRILLASWSGLEILAWDGVNR